MLKDIVDTSKHLLAVEQMSTGTGSFYIMEHCQV